MAAFDDKVADLLAALDRVDISREQGTLVSAEFSQPRHFATPSSPAPEASDDGDEAMTNEACESKPQHPGDNLDSDVSDDESPEKREPDELYGDTLDDEDAAYVSENLRGATDAHCDAALSCPCCFVTVCYASQRHERYETQFRAEKAVNCRVQTDTIYVYERNKLSPTTAPSNDDEAYHAVVCSDCGTTVGVKPVQTRPGQPAYLHFFQVIPSHI
ncbi:hypothetical protein ACHHYP_02573 [Achlya hypogyna]|uniref:E2F-associated phosphoprotein n=1 Tax=Achlya hypogyna TaxID=1202772 RepID=A0A1V9Z5W1_ACHHY|nr:hypothetical protein ACHHYP_02573 [Achlya hypogyna]